MFHAELAKSAEFFTITYHAGAGGVVSYATTGERRGMWFIPPLRRFAPRPPVSEGQSSEKLEP